MVTALHDYLCHRQALRDAAPPRVRPAAPSWVAEWNTRAAFLAALHERDAAPELYRQLLQDGLAKGPGALGRWRPTVFRYLEGQKQITG